MARVGIKGYGYVRIRVGLDLELGSGLGQDMGNVGMRFLTQVYTIITRTASQGQKAYIHPKGNIW